MASRAAKPRETYSIHIEGDWTVEDLYIFPRALEQVYFLLSAVTLELDEFDRDRVERAFNAFPWQGGFSAVGFYNQLKFIVPKRDRLRIVSLRYASPGWIELAVIVYIATKLEKVVKSVAKSIKHCNATYHDIMKGMEQRKLLRLKVKRAEIALNNDELRFIRQSAQEMNKILNLADAAKLNSLTGSPYISLKVLLSVYRRVRTLATYQNQGKVDFRNEK